MYEIYESAIFYILFNIYVEREREKKKAIQEFHFVSQISHLKNSLSCYVSKSFCKFVRSGFFIFYFCVGFN